MKIDIICEKHPKYKAKGRPTHNQGDTCHACWILYFLSHKVGNPPYRVGVNLVGLRMIRETPHAGILRAK